MGTMRLSYKHVVLTCVTLGILFVWMSLHYSSKPTLDRQTSPNGLDTSSKNIKVKERSQCGLKLPFLHLDTDVRCQLKLPLKDSCAAADQLFGGKTERCRTKNAVTYCDVTSKVVTCDVSLCDGKVKMGYFNTSTGHMVWAEHSTGEELTQKLQDLIPKEDHSSYAFITCGKDKSSATQLLILPSLHMPGSLPAASDTAANLININILFIDSVSYYHFHRTLPKTLDVLNSISTTSTKVLSYPLFQSLKSRTYENLQALFSGEVDTNQTFATQAMPNKALKLETLLKPLKDKGYENLVIEDLCWHWEWGFSKDLLVHSKSLSRSQYWKKLMKAFDKASISNYGISPSSCEVLEANGHPDPFHSVPAVCYNGQYQLTYILQYLNEFHKSRADSGIAYSSFYSSNVPHDEWGTRVKTMDEDLANHIATVSKQSKTLTILFSDHGNAYGEFPQRHQQGRDEAYHPMLYLIVPQGVQQLLGLVRTRPAIMKVLCVISCLPITDQPLLFDKSDQVTDAAGAKLNYLNDRWASSGVDIMKNVVHNQARLVTVLDLHYLLKHIASPSPSANSLSEGLISAIPADRDCADLPLFYPNICICAETEKDGSTLSDTELKLLAEFASGSLTNTLIESSGGIYNMKCHVLLPVSYTHNQVTAHRTGGYSVTMDINYPSATSNTNMETIFVTVSYHPSTTGSGHTFIRLMAYERRSIYSVYRQCGDGPATESLCICESAPYFFNKADNWKTDSITKNLLATKRESLKINLCVYVSQNYVSEHGSSIYAINVCATTNYRLQVKVTSQKSIAYSSIPDNGWHVKPSDVQFLFVVRFVTLQPLISAFEFSALRM